MPEALLILAAGLLAITTAATWLTARLQLAGALLTEDPEHWTYQLARRSGAGKVHVYLQAMDPDSKIAAFALWLPGHQAIVVSVRHALTASPEAMRFIIGHELGHLKLGHARHGFIRSALGYGLACPRSAAQIKRTEDEADIFAWHLTGIPIGSVR